jgi:hypothetical protein
LLGKCPNGFEPLYSRKWGGLAQSCSCVSKTMVQERNSADDFQDYNSSPEEEEVVENPKGQDQTKKGERRLLETE